MGHSMVWRMLLVAPALAVLAAVWLGGPGARAQVQPTVDLELSMENRFTTPGAGSESVFVISVRNHSDATVRDIKVRFFGVKDLTLGRSVKLSEYFGHVADTNDGILDIDALEWTIPQLKGRSTATTKLQIDVFNVPDVLDPSATGNSLVRLQSAIVDSTPREPRTASATTRRVSTSCGISTSLKATIT